MIRKLSKVFFLLGLVTLVGCQKKNEVGLYSIYQLDKYKQEKPLIKLPAEWEKQAGLMTAFPKGIEVYRSTKTINSKGTNLFLVVFNPRLGIDLKPVLSTSAKTPSTFFNEEAGDVYAAINAGFFTSTTSLSHVQFNNTVSSVNVRSLTRALNGVNTTYYPTRAAFGLSKDFKPQVSWVYSVGTGNGVLFSYPTPSPNEEGKPAQAVPSATFPQGGAIWDVATVIGGSPMLVKDSVVNISATNEMISVDNTSSRARSAIGYLANGNIVLLAAEGGNAPTAPGLTLKEVADVMLEAGCKGAINLDGGGSSAMTVNGTQTIKPSDTAGERRVISALIVKKR